MPRNPDFDLDMARRRRTSALGTSALPCRRQQLRAPLTRWGRWIGLAILSLVMTIGLAAYFHPSLSFAWGNTIVQPPLSTQGSTLVDARGRTVLLRGVNWFGLETYNQAPHGLWSRDYQEMLAQIRSLGYNMIRLPYSVEALGSDSTTGIDFDIGNNQDLMNKTPLEVMDAVIEEANRQGLMILLDSHTLKNQHIPELWYGDGFTEEDWINTWLMLAERYRNQPNVIGADLKNEPHGQASWGTGDRATDWRLAAERAGNAILEVNPDWLIVVEGVENNVPGQRLDIHWQGGNLEGVRQFPVRLSNPQKLVYSPHEYGPGVFDQPWFSEPDFPENLSDRWEIGFHYIATQDIAPIFIGEFGGRQVDTQSREGIWQRRLVDFIRQNDLSFSYWSWNPNSADTGGILLDDWETIDQPKQNLLSQLLPNSGLTAGPAPVLVPDVPAERLSDPALEPAAEPSPAETSHLPIEPSAAESSLPPAESSPSAPASSTASPSAPATSMASTTMSVQTQIHSDWQTGFCASFQIINQGNTQSGNWQLTFRMNEAVINNSWNGSFNRSGSQYTVTPPGWAQEIWPQQTVDIGFCADKRGTDYLPTQVQVKR